MMKEIFENEHDVVTTGSGEEALELAQRDAPLDVVLMDVQLPGISGVEAGQRIKAFQHDVRILVLTALAQPEDAEQILESGCCDAFMTKPASVGEIRTKVEELLEPGRDAA